MPESSTTFKHFIENILPSVETFALRLVIAFVIWFIGKRVVRFTHKLMRSSAEKHHWEPTVSRFLESLVKWGLYALTCYLIVEELGFSSSSILAMFTSAGLALGLALQGSLSNFAGGVLILLLKPFRAGDYIIEDTHKNEGTVRSIDLFYTTLTTVDNRTIVIPNGMLSNSSLTNVTNQKERQLILPFSVSYEANLAEAKQAILSCIDRQEAVIRTPERPVQVVVAQLGDSSIVLEARLWVPTPLYMPTKWALNEAVKKALDEAGIAIPYPQMDVHMK